MLCGQVDWDGKSLTAGDVQNLKVKGPPPRRGGGNAEGEGQLKMRLPYPVVTHQHHSHYWVRALQGDAGVQSYSHRYQFIRGQQMLGEASWGDANQERFQRLKST